MDEFKRASAKILFKLGVSDIPNFTMHPYFEWYVFKEYLERILHMVQLKIHRERENCEDKDVNTGICKNLFICTCYKFVYENAICNHIVAVYGIYKKKIENAFINLQFIELNNLTSEEIVQVMRYRKDKFDYQKYFSERQNFNLNLSEEDKKVYWKGFEQELRRHELGKKFYRSDITKCDENTWKLKSNKFVAIGLHGYCENTVQFVPEKCMKCSAFSICKVCHLCEHRLRCDCDDFNSGFFCQHCHAVAMVINDCVNVPYSIFKESQYIRDSERRDFFANLPKRIRHNEAIHMKCCVEWDENFKVTEYFTNSSECYLLREGQYECNCKEDQICRICRICPHTISCPCSDNLSGLICKHAHVVALAALKKVRPETLSVSEVSDCEENYENHCEEMKEMLEFHPKPVSSLSKLDFDEDDFGNATITDNMRKFRNVGVSAKRSGIPVATGRKQQRKFAVAPSPTGDEALKKGLASSLRDPPTRPSSHDVRKKWQKIIGSSGLRRDGRDVGMRRRLGGCSGQEKSSSSGSLRSLRIKLGSISEDSSEKTAFSGLLRTPKGNACSSDEVLGLPPKSTRAEMQRMNTPTKTPPYSLESIATKTREEFQPRSSCQGGGEKVCCDLPKFFGLSQKKETKILKKSLPNIPTDMQRFSKTLGSTQGIGGKGERGSLKKDSDLSQNIERKTPRKPLSTGSMSSDRARKYQTAIPAQIESSVVSFDKLCTEISTLDLQSLTEESSSSSESTITEDNVGKIRNTKNRSSKVESEELKSRKESHKTDLPIEHDIAKTDMPNVSGVGLFLDQSFSDDSDEVSKSKSNAPGKSDDEKDQYVGEPDEYYL